MMSTIARFGFLVFLVWVPIPLGSNRPIFWLVNGLVVIFLLALFLSASSARRRLPTATTRVMALLVGGAGLLVLWMVLQWAPWTPKSLHNPAWAIDQSNDLAPPGAVSVNPSATLTAALLFLTAALAAVLAARISVTRSRSESVLNAVMISASVVGLWGLAALNLDWSQTIFLSSEPVQFLTSFFVNRNTAATFIGLGLVSALALMVSRLRIWQPARGWLPVLIDYPARAGPYLIFVVLLSIALVSTASRAGGVAVLIGCVAVLAVAWDRSSWRQLTLTVLVFVAGGLFLLLGTSSDVLVERLTEFDFSDQARWQFYLDTVEAIRDQPLLGHGAGTFADFYPLYRSPDAPTGVLLAAHNTYLQGAAELGVPVFVAVLGVLAWLLVKCVRAARRSHEPLTAAIATVGATVAVGVHALFDFSIQVQAVAIVYAAILGAGVSVASLDQAQRRKSEAAAVT